MANSSAQPGSSSYGQLFARECIRAVPWLVMSFIILILAYAIVVRPINNAYQRTVGQFISFAIGKPVDGLTPLNAAQIKEVRENLKTAFRYAAATPMQQVLTFLDNKENRQRLEKSMRRAIRIALTAGLEESAKVVRKKNLVQRASTKAKKGLEFAASTMFGEAAEKVPTALVPKVKQAMRENIEFTLDTFLRGLQTSPLLPKAKQNTKEAIEFTSETLFRKMRHVFLGDPKFVQEMKQNFKEAIDFAAQRWADYMLEDFQAAPAEGDKQPQRNAPGGRATPGR
ncbi:MAG: hypothetical protein HYY96_05645 [Candidatus Tectomicrobia bacterium]|nr:hypothetical protein [Candidatus Tectomicrobia bacterium]